MVSGSGSGVGVPLRVGHDTTTLALPVLATLVSCVDNDTTTCVRVGLDTTRKELHVVSEEYKRLAAKALTEAVAPPDMEDARYDWGQDHRPRVYGAKVLDLLPQPEWHIQYLVPKGDQILMVADAGAGKTSLLLEWAWMLAEGEGDWWGYELHPQEGKVLYLVTEGYTQPGGIASGIQRRYGEGVPEDLLFHFDDMRVGINEHLDEALLEHWCEFAASTPLQAIVVDTLNRTAGGLEENSSTAMSEYIRFWTTVQRVHERAHGFRPTLFIAHHVSRGRGISRGSTALPASVDVVIQLEREDQAEFTEVSCKKMKAAAMFKPWRFSLDWAGSGDNRHHPVIGNVTREGAPDAKQTAKENQFKAIYMVLGNAEEPMSQNAILNAVKELGVPIGNKTLPTLLRGMNGVIQTSDGWELV